MTTPRDPDRLVQAFLEEGPAVLPDRVLDAVRDDIHQTHQRVVFGPWRTITMPRAVAAAAVVAVVAFGGIAYWATRSVAPNVGSTPSPSVVESAVPPVMPAFHNNGAILVEDNGLRAINPATGKAAKGIHLPDRPDASEVTWSPDGMQLAYTAPGGLYVLDVATGESRRIDYCGIDMLGCTLAWSPDGSRIAVARGPSPLELIDPTSGESTTLETPEGTVQPTWSPDGRRIAFQAIEGFGTDPQHARLYVINRDGSDLRLLVEMDAVDPSWSPDGSTIAFIRGTPITEDVYGEYVGHLMLLELDGSEPRELVEVGTSVRFEAGLTWSPDGARLALIVPGLSGEGGLHIVNADGTDFHRISNGGGSPAWRPIP
jgi:dipeptidyl aminopeptidase/acylaminoacyl peptidase